MCLGNGDKAITYNGGLWCQKLFTLILCYMWQAREAHCSYVEMSSSSRVVIAVG